VTTRCRVSVMPLVISSRVATVAVPLKLLDLRAAVLVSVEAGSAVLLLLLVLPAQLSNDCRRNDANIA